MNVLKEWCVIAPWGKIALISWGDPKGSPVLLVHGREDSVSTFVPLINLLPGSYYYVGMDLPGHGKSDPYPSGILLTRHHFLLSLVSVVEHLKWKKFIYLAHSMGSEHGLFYNSTYPGQIIKMILLDPAPAILRMFQRNVGRLFQGYYETYYENYKRYNSNGRSYSREQALRAVMNARGLTEEQAEFLLSRNLVPIEDGRYKLSWGKVLKLTAPMLFIEDFHINLFSASCPPTLVVSATRAIEVYGGEIARAHKFIDKLQGKIPNFYHVIVEGNHDLHFLTPELIADSLNNFLNNDYGQFVSKSKL